MTPESNAGHNLITHKLWATFSKYAMVSDMVDGNLVHGERDWGVLS